jgi:hypothetical protein
MSLKIYLLLSQFDFFPPNLGAVKDRREEIFHLVFFHRGVKYARKSLQNTVADNCYKLTDLSIRRVFKLRPQHDVGAVLKGI